MILGIGFEALHQFLFVALSKHLFTLSKVHSVMSFCVLLEAVHRWVVVDDGNARFLHVASEAYTYIAS